MLFLSIYNEILRSYRGKQFRNCGVTRRLWRIQHSTVLERSIEVEPYLTPSMYKVVCISKKTCMPCMRQHVGEICC